ADYLVVDEECRNLGLPRPTDGLSVGSYSHRTGVFFLAEQPRFWQRSGKIRPLPKKLLALVDLLEQHPELDVQLVPVSVFWGRAPSRENSIFKILFSDSWGVPGFFRKLF